MPSNTGFLERELQGRHYVVYVPRDLKPDFPTILYLHGRGESGTDGLLSCAIGLPLAILRNRARWPFLVVIPQKPTQESAWVDHQEWLSELCKSVEKEFPTDPHRRYLTGLSQGGHGTWRLAKSLPWQFAAVAPVCGWADPERAAKELRDMPLWAFHGMKDDVVKPEGSINAVEAIRAAGGNPKITLYPELGHNSWDETYQQSELPKWLLEHHL